MTIPELAPHHPSESQEHPTSLRQLQLCVLDIAVEVRRICQKHGITYFLIGGTLLGAVRHQGFIPWDDDMDIGMPRKDYDRFLKVCPDELNPVFFLQTMESDCGYGMGYAKVRINGTKLVEEFSAELPIHQGFFLDVFPIDHIPDSAAEKRFFYRKVSLFRSLLLRKCKYAVAGSGSIWRRAAFALLAKLFPKKTLKRWLYMAQTAYKVRPCTHAENLVGTYVSGREIFPVSSISGELGTIQFEGEEFACPKDTHWILHQLYGEYMQLPPIEKRYNRHQALQMDMGKYIPAHIRRDSMEGTEK